MFKNRRVIFENHLFFSPSPWVEVFLYPRGGGTNLKVKGLNL